MSAAIPLRVTDVARTCAIIAVCALAAIAFGVLAAQGSPDALITVGVVFFFAALAFALPLPWVALTLAALIPLQFYFPLGSALNLRGAFVFVAVATVRVLIYRIAAKNLWSWHTWVIPAAIFMLAALVASFTAFNRYTALKGIYDWLPVLASAFVIGEIVRSERLLRASVIVLILAGVAQAALGLIEVMLGLGRVVDALQSPLAAIFFQPNLLRERLSDLSFNWVLDGNIVPFGTFINGIDFAIFIAAILCLVLALLLGARRRNEFVILLGIAVLLGVALLQTFKGSGLIAIACGVAIILAMYLPRWSRQTQLMIGLAVLGGILIALPFSDSLIQRIVFLVQRELGVRTETGRITIWMHLLAQLPQRPLFGFGLNNAVALVPILPSMFGGAFVFNLPAPESAYVAALIETGLVGFGALAFFFGVVLAQAYRISNTLSPLLIGILAAIVAILAWNVTVTGLTTDQNGILLGVLIGLTFAIPHWDQA